MAEMKKSVRGLVISWWFDINRSGVSGERTTTELWVYLWYEINVMRKKRKEKLMPIVLDGN